ncbi:hypothetical protein M5Z83_10930, partial [Neisseria meningitidis]|nr:hypothetical protein [Neisseria meningitidis]
LRINACFSPLFAPHLRGNYASVATVTARLRFCCNFATLMPRHSRAGVNPDFQCLNTLSETPKALSPSFPPKRESANDKQQAFIGNDRT